MIKPTRRIVLQKSIKSNILVNSNIHNPLIAEYFARKWVEKI